MPLRSTAIPLTVVVLAGALAIAVSRPPAVAQTGAERVDERALLREVDASPRPISAREASGRLSSELIEASLEVAAEVDPSMADRLRRLCDSDPDAFEQVMQRSGRRLLGLARIREDDPGLYASKLAELRIEAQVNGKARALRDARRAGNEAAAVKAESELRGLLRIQVALAIKSRGDYIRRLEENLAALREQLEEQIGQFDEIVERQLEQLARPDAPVGHPLLAEDVPPE